MVKSKNDRRTNNDLQNTTQKTNDRATQTPLKTNNDLQNTTQKTNDLAIRTPLKDVMGLLGINQTIIHVGQWYNTLIRLNVQSALDVCLYIIPLNVST